MSLPSTDRLFLFGQFSFHELLVSFISESNLLLWLIAFSLSIDR